MSICVVHLRWAIGSSCSVAFAHCFERSCGRYVTSVSLGGSSSWKDDKGTCGGHPVLVVNIDQDLPRMTTKADVRLTAR